MRRKFLIRKIKQSFECQRCNLCCKAPGQVFLEGPDAARIAAYLGLEIAVFRQQYCRHEDRDLVLKTEKDGSCIFLTGQGCQIHAAKPKQCRQFPQVWRDWDAYEYCEGIKKLAKYESKEAQEQEAKINY